MTFLAIWDNNKYENMIIILLFLNFDSNSFILFFVKEQQNGKA